MNDAAESFIVFEECSFNGDYISDFEGEITIDTYPCADSYTLIVHQGHDNVFTMSFKSARSETYLFDYGKTGHFWIKGHEKLRIIDYWLGLVREKMNILGPDYCNETERDIYNLAHFRPLRYYHSVPEKYMLPNDYIHETPPEAAEAFRQICFQSGNKYLLKFAEKYSDRKYRSVAKILAAKKSASAVDYLINIIQNASSDYTERSHVKKFSSLIKQAEDYAEQLRNKGMKVKIFREEPFEITCDSMTFSVTVFAEKSTVTGIKTYIRNFKDDAHYV